MVSQWVDELGARPTDWVDGPSGGNVWQLYTKDTTSLPGRIAEKRPGVVLGVNVGVGIYGIHGVSGYF